MAALTERRCTATAKTNHPCQAWAVKESQLPRCSAHGSCAPSRSCNPESAEGAAERTSKPVGAPRNNKNAEKHGYYSNTVRKHTYSWPDTPLTDIRDIIADLATKQLQLSRLIEAKLTERNTDKEYLGAALHFLCAIFIACRNGQAYNHFLLRNR